MKSLSILPLLFAASQAFLIEESGPPNPVPINQRGEATLYCKTDEKWFLCEFTHESRSCKINQPEDGKFLSSKNCVDSKMLLGEGIDGTNCKVLIKDVKIKEDAGEWTCRLKKGPHSEQKEQKIQVEFKKEGEEPIKHPDPKPINQVKNTNGTNETSALTGVRSAILAFTFLLTAVLVAGWLVLLPKSWPLLRSQCSWN